MDDTRKAAPAAGARLARLRLEDYPIPEDLLRRLESPALVVFADRVRENLATVIGYAGGDPGRLRLHVKTTKIPAVLGELADAGIRHFKCATPREAGCLLEVLRERKIRDGDVLLAYPALEPGLDRLGGLADRYPEAALSVLCEDPGRAAAIPASLGIFADVNPGMNRTGIPLAERRVITDVARAAGSRFRGLHFYEGHVHDPTAAARRARAGGLYEVLLDLVRELVEAGLAVREVVTSGTPTFRYALEFSPFRELPGTVHRVSPGTVVYHDLRSDDELEDLDLTPAALVLARVVSHPAPGVVTCDAGSKSLAAEAGDPVAVVVGHPGLVAGRPSEEHLPLAVGDAPRPPRGAVLLLVPRHVCPTVNLAESALLVESGRSPRVVSVAARAHDLLL